MSVEALTEPAVAHAIRRYEYKIIDTGAEGWRVVGVTTKKQLLIAPPAAIILMRELRL